MTTSSAEPHLTPAKLVGQRFAPDIFGNTKIALIGYCPPPAILDRYAPIATTDQYFIHVSPDSVKRLSHNGIPFLSLVHVYGGPVSAATVEELAYYGFDYILAYGLAGGLGTQELRMGDFYRIDSALVADGTTPHYTREKVVMADALLRTQVEALCADTELAGMRSVRAISGDAIYREDDAFLDNARQQACDVVNLDSSHLYAVAQINSAHKSIRAIECGVISDVAGTEADPQWDSTLSVMLAAGSGDDSNPLARTGKIVEFYIERLAPALLGASGR